MRLRNTFLGLLVLLFVACTSGNSFDSTLNKLTSTSTPVRTPTPTSTETLRSAPTPSYLPPTPTSSTLLPTPTPQISLTPSPTSIILEPTPNTRQPTVTPTAILSPSGQLKEKRIVFVAGLCSSNSKDDFDQFETWIVKNMDYRHSDFDYYNYSINGRSGEPYDSGETLKSIDNVTDERIQSSYLKGSSAENFRNFMMNLHSVHENTEFYVIAHSLGGDVALYALNIYTELQEIIHGILTVNSPLRGEGLIKLNAGRIFTCVKDYEDVKHLIPIPVFVDLKEDSRVIRTMDIDYSITGNRIITLANSNDPALVSDRYSSGVLGTLDGAMVYIRSFAIDPTSENIFSKYVGLIDIAQQHRIPLYILDLEKNGKKDETEFVGEALRCLLIGDKCAYSNGE